MPEAQVVDGQSVKIFNMDDEDDLYGDQPDQDGKFAERGGKNDNCVVQ